MSGRGHAGQSGLEIPQRFEQVLVDQVRGGRAHQSRQKPRAPCATKLRAGKFFHTPAVHDPNGLGLFAVNDIEVPLADEHAGPVREFFMANAGYWIEEYHLDGLRLDATQTIHDRSETHVTGTCTTRAPARPKPFERVCEAIARGRRRTLRSGMRTTSRFLSVATHEEANNSSARSTACRSIV